MIYATIEALRSGLADIAQSPRDAGELKLIVRRPQTGNRQIVEEGELDPAEGLVGDNWKVRFNHRSPGQPPNPETQLNIMNSRVIALLAGDVNGWAMAGDQLFLDLDLSAENMPAGTRLSIGSAVIEVTAKPHTGCGKFAARFGKDAMDFVNSPEGRRLRLRGVNARVVRPGFIRIGDLARKTRVADET
jgi:hypothetical protein